MQFDGLRGALPEAVLLLMAVVVLLCDLFLNAKKNHTNSSLVYRLAQATLFLVALVVVLGFGMPKVSLFSGAYILDPLSATLKISLILLTAFSFVYAKNSIRSWFVPSGEFTVLLLMALLGAMVLVSTTNLLVLYLGLELLSLSLYTLAALCRSNQGGAIESAMKYFILGSLASIFMLYGISLVYGFSGSLEMSKIWLAIHEQGSEAEILMVSMVLMLAGAAFKLGLVPFHSWVPDVYEGVPTPIVGFIAAVPKVAVFGLFIRMLTEMFPAVSPDWQFILVILSVLSIALGNLFAIVQTNIRRLLAYSAIGHMGYCLLGLIAATPKGYAAAYFYMLTYALSAVGIFGAIALLAKKGIDLNNIDDLKGLGLESPWFGFVMVICLFSLAGIPPLVGFYAKFMVLNAVVSIDLLWLAVYGVVFAIVGAYYYLRVIKTLFFEQPLPGACVGGVIAMLDVRAMLILNALLLLGLGVFPSILFELCSQVFQ